MPLEGAGAILPRKGLLFLAPLSLLFLVLAPRFWDIRMVCCVPAVHPVCALSLFGLRVLVLTHVDLPVALQARTPWAPDRTPVSPLSRLGSPDFAVCPPAHPACCLQLGAWFLCARGPALPGVPTKRLCHPWASHISLPCEVRFQL